MDGQPRADSRRGARGARGRAWLLGGLIWLGGCGGDYDGRAGDDLAAPGGDPGPPPSGEAFFAERVQPRLDFCRNCHVPEGVADEPEGERFMLSTDSSQDETRLRESWERLGGNDPVSPILTHASGAEEHSGGAPWPEGSQAYRDVEAQLRCFESPERCEEFYAEADADSAKADRTAAGKAGHDAAPAAQLQAAAYARLAGVWATAECGACHQPASWRLNSEDVSAWPAGPPVACLVGHPALALAVRLPTARCGALGGWAGPLLGRPLAGSTR